MKRLLLSLLLLCLLLCAGAEEPMLRVELRQGTAIVGTVVYEDADLLVLRGADGTRYQCLRADISRMENYQAPAAAPAPSTPAESAVVLRLQASGGVSQSPNDVRPAVGAELCVGHNNLLRRNIFLGGGLGISSVLLPNGQAWTFLPLVLRTEVPFRQSASAPVGGMAVGYSWAVGKRPYSLRGGLVADLSLGWRFRFNPRNALTLALGLNTQQCEHSRLTTEIGSETYTYTGRQTLLSAGLRVALQM